MEPVQCRQGKGAAYVSCGCWLPREEFGIEIREPIMEAATLLGKEYDFPKSSSNIRCALCRSMEGLVYEWAYRHWEEMHEADPFSTISPASQNELNKLITAELQPNYSVTARQGSTFLPENVEEWRRIAMTVIKKYMADSTDQLVMPFAYPDESQYEEQAPWTIFYMFQPMSHGEVICKNQVAFGITGRTAEERIKEQITPFVEPDAYYIEVLALGAPGAIIVENYFKKTYGDGREVMDCGPEEAIRRARKAVMLKGFSYNQIGKADRYPG